MFYALRVCLLSLFLLIPPFVAWAEVNIINSSGDSVDTADEDADAASALQQSFGLSPADFGIGTATGPDGQPLSEEELEVIRGLRSGEGDAPAQQMENDPANQVYRGAADTQKVYDPPRTHLMYQDTKY